MYISKLENLPLLFRSNNFHKESTLFEKSVSSSWTPHCFQGKSYTLQVDSQKGPLCRNYFDFWPNYLNTASAEACLTPVHSQNEMGRMRWRRRRKPRNGSSSWPASSGGSPFSSGWARSSASSRIPYRSPEQRGIFWLVVCWTSSFKEWKEPRPFRSLDSDPHCKENSTLIFLFWE